VVRSVRPYLLQGFAASLTLAAAAGCSTTQELATRLQLNSARIRTAETPVRVTRPNPAIKVQTVALVQGHGQVAVVVRVANRVATPLSDLPILVGLIKPGGIRVLLNRSPDLDYFQSHLPLVPVRGQETWVFTHSGRVPAGAKPFAVVGDPPTPAVSVPRQPPSISALTAPGGGGAGRVSVRLHNPSSVPQYHLQVYAVAQRGGRYLAAGQAAVEHLSGGASQTLQLSLVGNPVGAQVAVAAPPTIFR
jgi:hypothetical protein